MSEEPRMTLADETTAGAARRLEESRQQTVKPHQTMDVVHNGLSALINIVGDIQERLAKLEGSDSLWVETMQATILSEAEQAVETACKDVDWENLAEQAVQNTDCGYIIESGVESAVDQIEWEDHASEAVEEAVRDLDIGELVAERLAKVRIGIIN
jgi:hypothetical protein